jgi:hypothetical protein
VRLDRIKLIFATACFCILVCSPCNGQHPSQEQHDWVGERFFSVFEELFPIERSSIGYRSYRDLYTDELEYSFVFNSLWRERRYVVNAVVRVADSVSLYDQIMALHRRNPNESIESIKGQLRIRERILSEEDCPAVRSQYDEFYRLRLVIQTARDRADVARGRETIILHPRVHIFRADISGGRMNLILAGSDHPFVRWAEGTRVALENCGGR